MHKFQNEVMELIDINYNSSMPEAILSAKLATSWAEGYVIGLHAGGGINDEVFEMLENFVRCELELVCRDMAKIELGIK